MMNFRTLGIDRSKWQYPFIANTVLPQNKEIAFIIDKISQGAAVDTFSLFHFMNGNTANYQQGYYHFYDNSASWNVQAEVFCAAFEMFRDKFDKPGPEMATLDLEVKTVYWPDIAKWLEYVHKRLNIIPYIYTSQYSWDTQLKGQNETWAAAYPLWVAQYPFGQNWQAQLPMILDPECSYPVRIPKVWDSVGYKMWQFTSVAKINGYSNNLDMNVLVGVL